MEARKLPHLRVCSLEGVPKGTLQFRGLALGLTSKAWIPVWVRASLDLTKSEFSNLWIRAGFRGESDGEMEFIDYAGRRAWACRSPYCARIPAS